MGAVVKLLERLGFVRLRDFGLIISPERRLLTTRSAVLDDGFGGIVVGWADSDLATTELPTWGTNPAIAVTAKPVLPPQQFNLAPAAAQPISPPQPINLAPEPCEEDPWEWEIAMARARAASDVDEPVSERDWEIAMARARAASDVTEPVAAPKPAAHIAPPAKPVAEIFAASIKVRAETVLRTLAPQPEPVASAAPPRTIIPVPTLPTSADPRLVRGFGDLTRTSVTPPRRFPSATKQRIA
jgi:hypothetical protein